MTQFPLQYGSLRGGGVATPGAGTLTATLGGTGVYYPLKNAAFGEPGLKPQRQALLDYEGFGTVRQQTALQMPAPAAVPVSQLDGFVRRALPGPASIKGIPGLLQPGHLR